MQSLSQWAHKWGVPAQALDDLHAGMVPQQVTPMRYADRTGEDYVTSEVRLAAGRKGIVLMRNNVGALPDKSGRYIRYGLMNDTPQMNEVIKSADLIGIERVTIRPEHVGSVLGRFLSVECKEVGWKWTGKGREVAQKAWADFVIANGGRALILSGTDGL